MSLFGWERHGMIRSMQTDINRGYEAATCSTWKGMLLSEPYPTLRAFDRRKTPPMPVELDRRLHERRNGRLHLLGPGKMPPDIKMAA